MAVSENDFYWQTIQKGSLSFALASRFLPPATRGSVWQLYTFCRYADDAVDCSKDPITTWQQLRSSTDEALLSPESQNSGLVFEGLRHIKHQHAIPSQYIDDLLEGMRQDITSEQPRDFSELKRYCYHVAGTVGAMFCYMIGIRAPAALQHAIDLGCAMQITNIARDVLDDHNLGRCYLPKTYCADHGVIPAEIGLPQSRPSIAILVRKLLLQANELYKSGDKGLNYLPLRTAFAVAVARCVYAAIGDKVLKLGPAAWDQRVYITPLHKALLVGKALWLVGRTIPTRCRLAITPKVKEQKV